jgi:hypothetical protein
MSSEIVLADLWPDVRPRVTASEIRAEDPSYWAEEFHEWARSACIFRDHCFGGLAYLHKSFSAWCIRRSVPASRKVFEWLLRDQGFPVNGELVYGLLPAAEFLALEGAAISSGKNEKKR